MDSWVVSWLCALCCVWPAICSLPLFQASRAGFPRPHSLGETARRPPRRSTGAQMRTTLGGDASRRMQEWGEAESDSEVFWAAASNSCSCSSSDRSSMIDPVFRTLRLP
ncbi:hypothetical protein V8E51_007147 [Hyaloscypha variabilis]